VLTRYLLLQVPSWILLGAVLLVVRGWRGLPLWIAVAILGAWILKDLVLYPFVKHAYDPTRCRTPAEMLVGQRGTAEQDLDPDGYVRVRGELWSATSAGGHPPVRRGEKVLVREIDRMRLLIEPEPRPPGAGEANREEAQTERPGPARGPGPPGID